MRQKNSFNQNWPFENNGQRKFGDSTMPRGLDEKPLDQMSRDGVDIKSLPTHLYAPNGADTVDARNLVQLSAQSQAEILRIECPPGRMMMFTGYAIFNDALLFNNVEFIPRINGSRIFPYHGFPRPNGSYKISLGLGPDLNNSSLIECQQMLLPTQVLTWEAINKDVVSVSMGVRMKGYSSAGLIQVAKTGG